MTLAPADLGKVGFDRRLSSERPPEKALGKCMAAGKTRCGLQEVSEGSEGRVSAAYAQPSNVEICSRARRAFDVVSNEG